MTTTVREIEVALDELRRTQWGRIMSAAVGVARDLDLAEDSVQDGFVQALRVWPRDGVPTNPAAWLTRVACRRVLEVRRREQVLERKLPLLVVPHDHVDPEGFDPFQNMPDDRVRLIFTCCHPALDPEARVALTLRLVCGLSSDDVARCFLLSRTTMQARLTRAKRKIARAGIPYGIPRPTDLPARLVAVLDCLHLLYTAGHVATSGPNLVRDDLTRRGLELARLVQELLPEVPEATAFLALVLLTEARRKARVDEGGQLVPLDRQDRALWNQDQIAEGDRLLRRSLAKYPTGRFALMATVAALHDGADTWEDTDWAQIAGVYDLMLHHWPSPVVALNRAVAHGYHAGPEKGLRLLAGLQDEPVLTTYPYLYAALAEFHEQRGDHAQALDYLHEAIRLAGNDADAAHLRTKLHYLHPVRRWRA